MMCTHPLYVVSNMPRPLQILWLLSFLWVASLLTYWLIRRIRGGRYLFRPQIPNAIFAENWTSGRSLSGRWARWGGAGNCLWVAVTPDQLLVGPHFPFNLGDLGRIYRLEHQIAAQDLISVEQREPMFGRTRALITFRTPGAESQETFELRLRNLPRFLTAIQMLLTSQAR